MGLLLQCTQAGVSVTTTRIFAAVATMATCLSCGEGASPILEHRPSQTPVVPWELPSVGLGTRLIGTIAGSSAPPERSPEGAWFFVKVEKRSDVVDDATRELLYISSENGQVFRYDMREHVVQGSWDLGGKLLGMDLSPDGNALLVADGSEAMRGVHHIDLVTKQARPIALSGVGQPVSVAFIDAGRALVATHWPGNLLLLSLGENRAMPLRKLQAPTRLVSNADQSVIAFADNLEGFTHTLIRYIVAENTFEEVQSEDNALQVAFHPLSDQVAVAADDAVVLYDSAVNETLRYPFNIEYPFSVGYAANGEQLLIASRNRSGIEVYETSTLRRISALAATRTVSEPVFVTDFGGFKTSRDGRYLFANVKDGVVIYVLEL